MTPRAARVFGLLAVAWLGAAHAYGENGHGRWTAEAQEGAETKQGSIESANADPPPKPLPTCGDVSNCFDCFLQQECAANPLGGDPLCSPCGWCATNVSKTTWAADVKGECVAAPIGIIDFCQLVDPGADRYCPESVCKVGDWGCNCKDNMCPAVEKIMGFLTVEGLYVVLICVMSFGVCLATMCFWCVCGGGPARRIVVVHQYPPRPADVEQQPVQQTAAGTSSYSRFE